MTAAQFTVLTSQDVDGPMTGAKPNDTPSITAVRKDRARKMRSFLVPSQFKDAQSKNPNADRTVNVFLAVACSDGLVWVLIDFARLVKYQVISRAKPWSANDLDAKSTVCLNYS